VDTLEIVLIAAAALVAIVFASRMASRNRKADPAEADPSPAAGASPAAGLGPTGAPLGGELVAVIAAAIAAESGMEIGSFRVAGISAAGGQSVSGGFNTPPWGFVDRISRAARN